MLLHGDVKFMEGCPAIVLLLTGVQLSVNLLVGVGYVFSLLRVVGPWVVLVALQRKMT